MANILVVDDEESIGEVGNALSITTGIALILASTDFLPLGEYA